MNELVNCPFMCTVACRFDVFVLVNFFHLWKLSIHCPGRDDDDDKQWHLCDMWYVCPIFTKPFIF